MLTGSRNQFPTWKLQSNWQLQQLRVRVGKKKPIFLQQTLATYSARNVSYRIAKHSVPYRTVPDLVIITGLARGIIGRCVGGQYSTGPSLLKGRPLSHLQRGRLLVTEERVKKIETPRCSIAFHTEESEATSSTMTLLRTTHTHTHTQSRKLQSTSHQVCVCVAVCHLLIGYWVWSVSFRA